jgi:two-component system, OmpR family, sensor histidine kinase KdpD
VTPAESTTPSTDPLSRALSGVIPPIALLALLVVAMYPFRDDLGSGTVALILLLPPLVATVGGLWVALAMAAVCAGALNFFFIHPYYSFRIESGESVAAFFIYLLVAAIVAVFASRIRAAERTAARKAAESAFLHRATVDLLTADPIIPMMRTVLGELQAALGLAAVRLQAASPATGPIDERAGEGAEAGRLVSFPVSRGDAILGTLDVTPGAQDLVGDERRLLEQFAEVVAIAMSHQGRSL